MSIMGPIVNGNKASLTNLEVKKGQFGVSKWTTLRVLGNCD